MCKKSAIRLFPKPVQFVPPKDHDALLAQLERNKPTRLGKTLKLVKAMLGRKP